MITGMGSPRKADNAEHEKDKDECPELAVGVVDQPRVEDIDEDGVDKCDPKVDDEVPGKVGKPEDKRIHSSHQLNLSGYSGSEDVNQCWPT